MPFLLADRVQETSTSTGTGNFTLAGAVTGFLAFSAKYTVNDTTWYLIEAVDANGVPTGAWEVGLGTYSAANTLVRSTVFASTNADALVSFAAGTKRVAVVVPAEGVLRGVGLSDGTTNLSDVSQLTIANALVTDNGNGSATITIPGSTNNVASTSTAASSSFSTAVTTVRTLTLAAGEVVAGSEYEFFASLRVINTITVTNLVIAIDHDATNVLTLTQALGANANASPGRTILVEGRITFYSNTQAEASITAYTGVAAAFNAVANTSAPVTVSASGAANLSLKINTSGSSSTVIVRQATIQRVK